MNRAVIQLETTMDVQEFIKDINSDGTIIKYTITNKSGSYRVNARSFLGVLYASAEFGGVLYLINETNDNPMPAFVDKYRLLTSEKDGEFIHE